MVANRFLWQDSCSVSGLVNVAVKNHIIIPFQRLLVVINHAVIVRFVQEMNSET